jgi:hypothetical protein
MKPGKERRVILETIDEIFEAGEAIVRSGPEHTQLAEELFHAEPPYEIEDQTVNLALLGMRKTLEMRLLNPEYRAVVLDMQGRLTIASAASELGIDTSGFSEDAEEAMGDLTSALIQAGVNPEEYFLSKGLIPS